ncbi:hypothetical protein QTP88_005463 [Uroleucon formosanum]
MTTTMFQTVVLGLLVASGAFADVIHHKSGKQCHKKVTQKANNNGTLESSITNHSNVTNSHPSVFSSGEKSSGVSSTPAPFEDGTLPTPAPSVSKSLQQSTPPPFVISDLSSNSISSLKSTQPTPVPFQFSSLFSTPAPLAYSEKSIAPEDPFKSIVAFYSHSIPAPFTLNSSSLVSPAVSIKSYGTFGSQPIPTPFEYNVSSSTPAQFEHSTLSATPEDLFKSIIASYSQSISAPFSIESQSTAVPFTFSGSSSSPAVAGSIESFNTVGSHPIPTTYSYSQGNAFTQYGAQRFATVHYYQQSPIVVQPEWYKSYTSGSTATPVTDNHIVQSSFVSVSGQTGSDYAGSDYSKSNYAGSGIVKDSDSYGFDQQSFYGSTTPVPSSPQYKSSNFDSVNQQVYSAGGSATADSQQTEHLEVGKK